MPDIEEMKKTLGQLEGLLSSSALSDEAKAALRKSAVKLGTSVFVDTIPDEFSYFRGLIRKALMDMEGASTQDSTTRRSSGNTTSLRELRLSIETPSGRTITSYMLAGYANVKCTPWNRLEAGKHNSEDIKHNRYDKAMQKAQELKDNPELIGIIDAVTENRSWSQQQGWKKVREYTRDWENKRAQEEEARRTSRPPRHRPRRFGGISASQT